MNLNDKTKKVTETAIITALMTILVILGLFVMPIAIILFPVPYIILGVRHDVKYGLISIIGSGILLTILVDITVGIFITLLLGFLSVGLSYMIKKEFKTYQIITGGIVISIVSVIITINIIAYITGISVIGQVESYFAEMLKMAQEVGLPNSQTELLKNRIETAKLTIPSTMIIFSIFNTYINYWVSVAILRRLGHNIPKIPKFKYFRLPGNVVTGSLVIILCTSLIWYLQILYYKTIAINVMSLLMFIFFIQGISVIMYLLDKTKLNRVLKVFIIIFAMLYVPIIGIVGFIDAIFDFRKLRKNI
ncbi:MAG: DUF2232 domain-containing protein [Firmicutes bacterium]|nr:DUF2232 domain-containing protein [Bacillota bacterium]